MSNTLANCYLSVNSNVLIESEIANCYFCSMKTAHMVRRENFLALLSRYATNREFADRCELPPAFVSQIKTARRNIGDALARDIERALSLPKAWMDVLHDASANGHIAREPEVALSPSGQTLTRVTEKKPITRASPRLRSHSSWPMRY